MIHKTVFLLTYCLSTIQLSHIDKNNSDVIIKYSGHSDIERPVLNPQIPGPETGIKDGITTKKDAPLKEMYDDVTESVVFIPNDRPVSRNEDRFFDNVKVKDLIDTRRVGDLMRGDRIHIAETESPKADILFISGKNNENIEKPVEFAKKQERQDTVVRKGKVARYKQMNCNNLDCNNTLNSVCGGKEENKQLKYRLFLNECFFRKVNCGFQHSVNRYDLVPIENCKHTGAHFLTRPYVFKPIALPAQKKDSKNDTRRSFSSRRSLSMGVDGSFCAHACPVSCTEDYDPQCAASSSGQMKMFLNHCKLDYNSCLYKVVWHMRPLSECVGGKKADMTQNRGFIGWMQRAGIVDGKGRLVLS